MSAPRLVKDSPSNVGSVAERLVASYAADAPLSIEPGHELPSPPEVSAVLGELRELLFPGYNGGGRPSGATVKAQVEMRLASVRVRLCEQIFRGVHHRCRQQGGDCRPCLEAAARITDEFIAALPDLRALLMTDVRAAFEGDPAATGADEVVFSYPGIQAISVFRVAHKLLELGCAIVPRMMTEIAHSETGIDIHPGAAIGEAFFIDHGTGVVIGETTVIGARVRLYQGVTLGALSLPTAEVRALARHKRHPTIEDDVIIYANATILGGETVIGRGAVVGGNSWITESIPARTPRSL
jgi:serine O-acetyltransferase